MIETLINVQQISHIEIRPLTRSEYIWCDEVKEKKVFFNLIQTVYPTKEGFYEFDNALHGRSYYNEGWGLLCKAKGIDLETYL
jgi:hypothetical protein